jgi:hypothetical protein
VGKQPGAPSSFVRLSDSEIEFSDFMLIFENSYLLLGNSKNSKSGLFGNLEKIPMQWSHKILGVCRVF